MPGRRHRKKSAGEGSHYFLAGNTLGWPVIGLAMFAANISTVHLVSFAETAYKYGMVYGNFEWMAGFTLILLSLFFAPLYLRSRVATLARFPRAPLQPPLPRLPDGGFAVLGDRDPHRRGAVYGGPRAAGHPRHQAGGDDPRHRLDDVLHHRARRAHRHLYHDRRPAGGGVDREHSNRPAARRRGVHHRRGLSLRRRLGSHESHAGRLSASSGRGGRQRHRLQLVRRRTSFRCCAVRRTPASSLGWGSCWVIR